MIAQLLVTPLETRGCGSTGIRPCSLRAAVTGARLARRRQLKQIKAAEKVIPEISHAFSVMEALSKENVILDQARAKPRAQKSQTSSALSG